MNTPAASFPWVALAECDHSLRTLFWSHPAGAVSVTLSAYYLTAKRCYLKYGLIGVVGLLLATAVSTAYRLDWVDLNTRLGGAIQFDSLAVICERLTVIALGSILVALKIGMRNGKDLSKANRIKELT